MAPWIRNGSGPATGSAIWLVSAWSQAAAERMAAAVIDNNSKRYD
jgi:hypothetical protein